MAADIGAFQTKYRQELILGFEDRQSRLRSTVDVPAPANEQPERISNSPPLMGGLLRYG